MKISDAKKEIEIEQNGFCYPNGNPTPVFVMNIRRPIQAEGKFDVHDIVTEQGKTGIKFSKYSKIAEAFHAKNRSVLITLPEDALRFIRSESEKKIAELKADAQSRKTKIWYWNNDNEYYNLAITPDISLDFREDLREIIEILEKNQMEIWDMLKANSKPTVKQDWMRDNTTWYEVPAEIVEPWANKIIAERKKKEDEANQKHQTKLDLHREKLAKGIHVVALNSCWECGVTKILGEYDENMNLVRMPKELWKKAEAERKAAHRRSYEKATGQILSSVGFEPSESVFEFEVVSKEYDGC